MTKYTTNQKVTIRNRPGFPSWPMGTLRVGYTFDDIESVPNWISFQKNRWVPAYACTAVADTPPPPVDPPTEPSETGLNLYRTLHPFPATHNGMYWSARPANYPVAPNYGSFDVYSRLYPKPKKADGGAIQLTPNQWEAIRRKNSYGINWERWAVGGTAQILSWKSGSYIPRFHYPIIFGGNMVNVLEFEGNFARIATWPMDKDIPDDLPEYYWHRCWCVYRAKINPIRDAPCGVFHWASPAYMLALAHEDSAWVFKEGLIKWQKL